MTLPTSSTSRWVHPSVVTDAYGRGVLLVRALRGLALVGTEVAALALLMRLDLPSVEWSALSAWLENVPPEDAVVALVRLAALVTVGYLLVSTALYVLASLTRMPALIRGASALTLPSLRRIVDGVVAAAIVVAPTSLAFGVSPAAAQPAPPPAHAYSPSPAGDVGRGYTPTPAGGTTAVTPGPTRVVQPGDSLWTIAADHLASSRGVAVDGLREADIAQHWRWLVELNASALASGDPDVIYPGESVQLPSA